MTQPRSRLVVKARDEEFKPLENSDVRSTVQPVHLLNSTAETKAVEYTANPSSTTPGLYEATYVVGQTGAYSASANVKQSDGQVVGHAETGWTSDQRSMIPLAETEPRPAGNHREAHGRPNRGDEKSARLRAKPAGSRRAYHRNHRRSAVPAGRVSFRARLFHK